MEDKLELNIHFALQQQMELETTVVLIDNSLNFNSEAILIDQKHHGLISKIVSKNQAFSGKFSQTQILSCVEDNKLNHLILIGIGDVNKLTHSCFEKIGGVIFNTAVRNKISQLNVIKNSYGNIDAENAAALMASGLLLASYKFDEYLTRQKEEDKFKLQNITFLINDVGMAEKLYQHRKAVVSGVFLARDCINQPGNILYPESYANIIYNELDELGVDVEVLGEREMKNLGMGALLGVGQGSQNESKLVVIKYMGAGEDSNNPLLVLVGKGVTFDTGGISLKPASNMHEMKYDMAGSAAIVGVIKACALRRSNANVIGVLGLVENMPGGNAQRPGDIVTTMSGQTVEVLNTDAEGRLVLADAIWYAQKEFKPAYVIDLATLTGAISISLGSTYGGLFANDEELANNLITAGDEVDEKLWRMPLHNDYDNMLKSPVADIANIGNERGKAGSNTAAHFIGRFVEEGTKWAHLDIAGVAWNNKGSNICPKGAVGFGVKLLNQYIQDNHETK